MNLSVVVLTRNEKENIARALQSVKTLADEILVIDDGSTDGTGEIAKNFGAKIYPRPLAANFAGQRNFGLEKASGRWVLFLDADEELSSRLIAEVDKVVSSPSEGVNGYYLKRRDFLWGRELKHGEVGNVHLLRLARRTAGKWQRAVHETWEIFGRTKRLSGTLNHYPHKTLTEFIEHVRVFSEIHAREHYRTGKRSSLVKIIFMPKLKFIKGFIFKMGFLDGVRGFLVAMMMSFHSFLAWSNVWLMQKYKHFQES